MAVHIMIDPERITQRLFGGPYFEAMERLNWSLVRHPISHEVYDMREVGAAWWESRKARPFIGPLPEAPQ